MSMCKVCFNEIDKSFFSFKKLDMCSKCFSKLNVKIYNNKFNGVKLFSLYIYDDALKGLIYQFKGCYDIDLKNIFLERYKTYLKLRYKDYVLVPLPSTKEDDEIRGFNHVVEMYSCLGNEIQNIIYKKIDFKQSDLSKREREKIKRKLGVNNLNLIKNKKVLIIDDIITTGSSIKAAIELLKQGNPSKIEVMTIARNVHNDKNNGFLAQKQRI